MPTPALPESMLIEALNLAEMYGSAMLARKAGATDIPETTLRSRIKSAQIQGLRPTVRKDAPRIHQRERLGRMHVVIPDVQAREGVRTDHLEWIANFIVEKKPDVIVQIGDFADLPSLSLYDKGKVPAEGRRYAKDIKAAHDAMNRLMAPIEEYNRTASEKYEPRLVLTMGNHEYRADRYAEDHPEMEGRVGSNDLAYDSWGWEVVPFLKPIEIGIRYAHYFTSGAMERPVSSAAAMLRNEQQSATMGHVQKTDIAMHPKTQQTGLFCGTAYLHDERYLGYQGNVQRRQIIVKHEVDAGRYDLMMVSLRYLEKAYS